MAKIDNIMAYDRVLQSWIIDCLKMACNRVLQSWIIDCLKMYKISDKVIKFIMEPMKNWKIEFIACRTTLAEVKIQRHIFQRDSQSQLSFLNCNDATQSQGLQMHRGYKFIKSQSLTT